MDPQPSAGSPNPTPTLTAARWKRAVIGYFIGSFSGGLIGWLIDSAITNDPYGGIRIGIFLGGLFGALIGAGVGWRGVAIMLSMVVCSAVGSIGVFLLWKPDPGSFVMLLPTAIGGMAGAFLGLALGAVLLRARQKAHSQPL